MKSNIELSNKRIENAKKRIAKCINMLQTTVEEVKWACEAEEWNDGVVYDIEDAALKLGYSLATLYRWDDPEEEFKDEM